MSTAPGEPTVIGAWATVRSEVERWAMIPHDTEAV
jgi:hypothetical protein